MKIYITSLLLFISVMLKAQYTETFSYTNGTTSSSTWSTDCSACTFGTGDYFEVRDSILKARDTDGIAIFETSWIDISLYTSVVLMGDIFKTGDMEGPNTSTSSHHDFIDVEYKLDNGSWIDIKDYLQHGVSDSTFYGEDGLPNDTGNDDEWNGEIIQHFEKGSLSGDSIKIRINLRNSANTEIWGIDNIEIVDEALLPVELISFTGIINKEINTLKWITLSEINNKGFNILKSIDGINWRNIGWVQGNGTSSIQTEWVFNDFNWNINNYYQLEQVDFSNTKTKSNIVYIERFSTEEKDFIYITTDGKIIDKLLPNNIYIKYNTTTGEGTKVMIWQNL